MNDVERARDAQEQDDYTDLDAPPDVLDLVRVLRAHLPARPSLDEVAAALDAQCPRELDAVLCKLSQSTQQTATQESAIDDLLVSEEAPSPDQQQAQDTTTTAAVVKQEPSAPEQRAQLAHQVQALIEQLEQRRQARLQQQQRGAPPAESQENPLNTSNIAEPTAALESRDVRLFLNFC